MVVLIYISLMANLSIFFMLLALQKNWMLDDTVHDIIMNIQILLSFRLLYYFCPLEKIHDIEELSAMSLKEKVAV